MNIDTSKIKTTHWSELLLQMGAGSLPYQLARNLSYDEFWRLCPNGVWLLYFIAKEGSTPANLMIKAACQCARLALTHIPTEELMPLNAIETTERWLEGKATIEEVRLAGDISNMSINPIQNDSNAAYAVYAVVALTKTVECFVNDFAYAQNISTVIFYTNFACNDLDMENMKLKTANIIRDIIPMPTKMVQQFERLVAMKAFW